MNQFNLVMTGTLRNQGPFHLNPTLGYNEIAKSSLWNDL